MFDFGFSEMLIIGTIALVVLGPERLPMVARTAGEWIGKAQRFVAQVKSDIDRETELSELKRIQDEAKALADARAAADKKAKDEKDTAEKDAAAQEKAEKAARSEARRQITLILRNGGTVPDDLWQQSGYSAVTIAAMLRGRKG